MTENFTKINNNNKFLAENQLIFKMYKPVQKIDRGAFGNIYSVINIIENNYYAMKTEKINAQQKTLESEAFYLLNLQGGKGFPKFKTYGHTKNYNILVEELLGKSLYYLFIKNKRKCNIIDTCLIGHQILERLEWIHSKNLIYRDIKPENFLLGYKDPNIIYVVDFGLCKKYRSSKTGKHILPKDTGKFNGTLIYASPNVVKGKESSRRDDLISLGYMLIYLLKRTLPWESNFQNLNKAKYHELIYLKETNGCNKLFENIPNEFTEYINYSRNLKFEEDPNYSYLRSLFTKVIFKLNLNSKNINFSWLQTKTKFRTLEKKTSQNIINPLEEVNNKSFNKKSLNNNDLNYLKDNYQSINYRSDQNRRLNINNIYSARVFLNNNNNININNINLEKVYFNNTNYNKKMKHFHKVKLNNNINSERVFLDNNINFNEISKIINLNNIEGAFDSDSNQNMSQKNSFYNTKMKPKINFNKSNVISERVNFSNYNLNNLEKNYKSLINKNEQDEIKFQKINKRQNANLNINIKRNPNNLFIAKKIDNTKANLSNNIFYKSPLINSNILMTSLEQRKQNIYDKMNIILEEEEDNFYLMNNVYKRINNSRILNFKKQTPYKDKNRFNKRYINFVNNLFVIDDENNKIKKNLTPNFHNNDSKSNKNEGIERSFL